MKKLSDYLGNELIISQKNFWKREYELRSGEELIGQMRYPKIFSLLAEHEIQNEIYEFYRPGIFNRNVDIRKKGYQNPFAHFKSAFFGNKGVLELQRGIKLNVKLGYFKRQFEIYLGENDLLISAQSKFSFKVRSVVSIEKRSEIIDENPWILMFGFYLVQLRKRRSGAAS
jgi:hypothetical protein